MFVVDAMVDYVVETYSGIGLATVLSVESNDSLCNLPHLVKERMLSITIIFRCFVCRVATVLVVSEFRIEGETQYFGMCIHV